MSFQTRTSGEAPATRMPANASLRATFEVFVLDELLEFILSYLDAW